MKRRGSNFNASTGSARAAKLAALGQIKHAQSNEGSGAKKVDAPHTQKSSCASDVVPESPCALSGAKTVHAPPTPKSSCTSNVIPESPCPLTGADDEAGFREFSDMLRSIHKPVVSTPRKSNGACNTEGSESVQVFPAKPALGALSLLNMYDSEDSQQSSIFEAVSSKRKENELHENKPQENTADTDPFNLSLLSESLDRSLHTDCQAASRLNQSNDESETRPESDRFNMSQLNESLSDMDSSLHNAGSDALVSSQTTNPGDSTFHLNETAEDPSNSSLSQTLPTSGLGTAFTQGLAPTAGTSNFGAKTSDQSIGDSTSDLTSSCFSSQTGDSVSDTSILARTLSSTRLNKSTVSNEENNGNTTLKNSDGGIADKSVVFINESDQELQDEILDAIGGLAEGGTIVVPLEADEALVNEMIIDEAQEVLIEVVDVPADDSSTKPRKSNPEKWKKTIAKQCSDKGAAHSSLRGKLREGRHMGSGCKIDCLRKCKTNFSEAHRSGIFKDFGLYKTIPCNESGPEIQVCQKFFLETLGISQKWVKTALMKQRANHGSVPEDKRGKIKKPSPAKAAIKRGVIEHIKSFPTVEGHYTRKDSKSKYLAENLNKRIMYSLYKLEKEAANETKYASLRQYRDIFKTEFNLKFFRPKKDQCAKCLSWKNKTPQEKTEVGLKKFEKHLADKDKSNELKRKDIELVKTNDEARKTTCVFSCDLQKVLQCPKGMNRDFFFASKLSVYNFTVFVSGDQQGRNYVWDQTEANRGASEIASCLWHFISEKVESGITHFIGYSDNCSSQNKNQFLFSMYAMASMKYDIKITHRYLEVGHTHMEVDSVHARIENSVKYTDIFVPNQWCTAIRVAKKTRPHYEVIEVSQDMIFDFAPIASHQSWDRLKTSTFREVVFDYEKPGQVMYKTDFQQEEQISANIIKKGPGRRVVWKTVTLKKKYSAKIPVSPLTLKHLQGLCKSGAIPSSYAPYYMEVLPQITAEDQPPPEEISDLDQESDESDSSVNSDGDED